MNMKLNNSKLLITSGMHGDEYEVVDLVAEYLSKKSNNIPYHLYIQHLSPSAIVTKTRRNSQGNDLNRSFLKGTTDNEALKIMSVLQNQKFELALDFHEDPEHSEFYMYDSGKIEENELTDFKQTLRSYGIGLFTGIDDEGDPLLGFKFDEGYSSFLGVPHSEMAGTLWDYTLKQRITKRMLTLEIPGRESLENKAKIVKLIFENLLPKLYNGD